MTAVALGLGAVGLWLLIADRAGQPEVVTVGARPNDDAVAPFIFDPEIVEVTVGSTLRWVNRSETFHTVTFSASSNQRVSDGSFNESMFDDGATIERRFDGAGDFSYFCQPHAGFMSGRVRVSDAPDRSVRTVAGLALLATASVAAIAVVLADLSRKT